MSEQTRYLVSLLCAILIILCANPGAVSAQDAPPYLSHQGRLFDVNNEALMGTQTLTFRIHDGEDDTATTLWEESREVTLENGYYSAILGQSTALPMTVFDGATRYLGITVGDVTVEDELRPRLEITSVAYSLKSSVAENAIGDLTPSSIALANGNTQLNSDGSVNVGAATIAADGTITLGATTISSDGSVAVGATTINPDGSIDVAGNPVIAADGSVDSSSIAGTTLADLEASGCISGQLPQFDTAGGWTCITPSGGTVYTAGAGLALDGSNQFSVDTSAVQTRVAGSCGVGEAIQQINADGTVVCEVDSDTIYTPGAGIDITGGTISLIDTVDDDTTYSPGAGIDITAGTISLVDTIDDNTTYTAGSGLTLSAGNTFDVNTNIIQSRVTGACSVGQVVLGINADGSVQCGADQDTTLTEAEVDAFVANNGHVANGDDSLALSVQVAAPPPIAGQGVIYVKDQFVSGGEDAFNTLLLHSDTTNGSQTVIDSSVAVHPISVSGAAAHTTVDPFFGATSFDFTSGGFFNTADSPDWDLDGDFTVDFWIKLNSVPYAWIIVHRDYPAIAGSWSIYLTNAGDARLVFSAFDSAGSSVVYLQGPTPLPTGSWHHIGIVRSGAAMTMYVDGASVVTDSSAGGVISGDPSGLRIGDLMNYAGDSFDGYLDEVRVSKGIARWTRDFTPPSGPYDAGQNETRLFFMDASGAEYQVELKNP